MKEHPEVARALATGYPQAVRPGALRCCDCGCGLTPGEGYYPVAGLIFCRGCMDCRREEVRE